MKRPQNALKFTFCKLHINQIFQFMGWYFVYNTNINYFCNLSTNNYDNIWKKKIWSEKNIGCETTAPLWVWNDLGVKRPAPKMSATGHLVKNFKIKLHIDLKWPKMRLKVNIGHPKGAPAANLQKLSKKKFRNTFESEFRTSKMVASSHFLKNIYKKSGSDLIECFRTTFLHTHSWLNWVDEDDDEVGLKEKPEDTRYIKTITSK